MLTKLFSRMRSCKILCRLFLLVLSSVFLWQISTQFYQWNYVVNVFSMRHTSMDCTSICVSRNSSVLVGNLTSSNSLLLVDDHLRTTRMSGYSTQETKSWGHPVAFSTTNKYIAVFHRYRGVSIWEINSNEKVGFIALPGCDEIVAGAFDSDEHRFTAVLYDSPSHPQNDPRRYNLNYYCNTWDVFSGSLVSHFPFQSIGKFEALSANGDYIAMRGGGQKLVYRVRDACELLKVSGHYKVSFDPDNELCYFIGKDNLIVYNILAAKEIARIHFEFSFSDYPSIFAVSRENSVLAVGMMQEFDSITLVSLRNGRVLTTFHCGWPVFNMSLHFIPHTRYLIVGTTGGGEGAVPATSDLGIWRLPSRWCKPAF